VGPEREIGNNFNWFRFKKSGFGPNLYIFTPVGVERLYPTIWQTLLGNGWCIQHPSIHQPTCCYIRVMKGWRGAKWITQSEPKYYQIQTCCIPVPSRELLRTYLCFVFLKRFSFTSQSFCQYPKYFVRSFLARTWTTMQEKCVNSADNFCCVGGKVSFITEECHKSDHQENLPPSLWASQICDSIGAANPWS